MSKNKANLAFLKLIEEAQITPSFDEQQAHGISVKRGSLEYLEATVKAGLLPKETACKLWAKSIGHAYYNPLTSIVTEEARQKLSLEATRQYNALGLYFLADVLTVAMAEPDNLETITKLESCAGCKISPVFSLPCEIFDAIKVHHSNIDRLSQSVDTLEKSENLKIAGLSRDNMSDFIQSESLVSIFDTLLFLAIKEKASHIHLEPHKTMTQVRFRCHGRFVNQLKFPMIIHKALITRFGALCGFHPGEKGFSLERGSFTLGLGTGKASFEVSFLPCLHGAKTVITIRLTKTRHSVGSLQEMLIATGNLRQLEQFASSRQGLLIFAGLPGDGISGLFNAMIKEIASTSRSIHSLEDFIEVEWPGMTQSHYNLDPSNAQGAPALLEAILNQDADVIALRGMNDEATAAKAVDASLQGHFVLATLSANGVRNALLKLNQLGLRSDISAAALLGVVSHRLARRICNECQTAYQPSAETLQKYFNDWENQTVNFYRGEGCANCQNSGYDGHVSLFEILTLDDRVRAIMAEKLDFLGSGSEELDLNWQPFLLDGLLKVLLGLTTVEEVERVCR